MTKISVAYYKCLCVCMWFCTAFYPFYVDIFCQILSCLLKIEILAIFIIISYAWHDEFTEFLSYCIYSVCQHEQELLYSISARDSLHLIQYSQLHLKVQWYTALCELWLVSTLCFWFCWIIHRFQYINLVFCLRRYTFSCIYFNWISTEQHLRTCLIYITF